MAVLGPVALTALAMGCRHGVPEGAYVIRSVQVEGVRPVEPEPLLKSLATAPSPRFLGIWDGLGFDYEIYDENLLARDLERVERYLRARGYYEAKVRAARVIELEDGRRVRVEIAVTRGQPVRVRRVFVEGIEKLPLSDGNESIAGEVLRNVQFTDCPLARDQQSCVGGDVFDEADFEATKSAIGDALANRGFAFVKVEATAEVDVAGHVADVRYLIEPGPRATFGAITIEGLEEIPERKVRAQLAIHPGDPYDKSQLDKAEDQVTALGRFSMVEVREDLSHPERAEVPLTIKLRESALRGVRAGVGARFDVVKTSTHVLGGWDSQNFLGGMRSLRLEDRFGLIYYPLRVGLFEGPIQVLPENSLVATLRQPSFIEGRTEGILRADVNVYPVLYRLPEGVDPDEERIIGFLELRGAAGVERPFFARRLTVGVTYNLSENIPLAYRRVGPDPAGLERVLVGFPQLVTDLDFRDDRLAPTRGFRFLNTLQVAGAFGEGDVADVRIQPDARVFLPVAHQITLAVRGSIGLLFPRDYGDTLDPAASASLDPASAAAVRDQAKLLFRVFYSGGPNSNRGYPFRGVGPHGPLGFLKPTTVPCEFDPPPYQPNPDVCNRPLGGLTLWEGSLELRFPIWGKLGAVVFVDASDLTRRQATFRPTSPHLSPGAGVRYTTPVGPLRVDVGYRAIRTFAADPETELSGEPDPGRVLGLPMAIHLSLGEAF
ncbi:MAG: BamA/TamA family outer membrane protein [Polyangiaceae bacterium]|nr:BamA/TamA family outer membrane protein [Polyangiaceae bacterium]